MLVELGHQQNYRIWGNDLDMSEQSHALGYLMWLQYHCSLVFLAKQAWAVFLVVFCFFLLGGLVWCCNQWFGLVVWDSGGTPK